MLFLLQYQNKYFEFHRNVCVSHYLHSKSYQNLWKLHRQHVRYLFFSQHLHQDFENRFRNFILQSMIWFAYFVKNSIHLTCRNIKNVVFFRKILTFVDLFINHELSFIFCLQSIRKHRLIKIWKIRIRKIFNNIRLRNRFVLFLFCQKNRFFYHTKSQTFFTFRCNQNFHQNFHFCNQNFHSHDFDLRFRLRFRRFFDFRFQIMFVAFVSIISISTMIRSIIHVSINDIFEIVDR